MSRVTTAMLTFSGIEDGPTWGEYHHLNAINAWLAAQRYSPMRIVNQYPCMAAGCWKHFDEEGFVQALRALSWEYPEHVRLMIDVDEGSGEDDSPHVHNVTTAEGAAAMLSALGYLNY